MESINCLTKNVLITHYSLNVIEFKILQLVFACFDANQTQHSDPEEVQAENELDDVVSVAIHGKLPLSGLLRFEGDFPTVNPPGDIVNDIVGVSRIAEALVDGSQVVIRLQNQQ